MMDMNQTSFKWTELLLGMLMSAGSSALAVVWSVSATQTSMQKDIETLKQTQAAQTTIINNMSSQASLQTTQIAVTDTNYKNIIITLGEIKDQLRSRR